MTKIPVGFLVVTFLVACAVEQARSEATPDSPVGALASNQRAEAPAYNGGDTWVFRVKRESMTQSSADAIGKGGDFEVIFSGKQREIFRLESGGRVRIDRPGDLFWLLPTGRVLENAAKLFDFPLFVGKKWELRVLRGTRWLPAINEVTAIETIETPAGTFRAFRIKRLIVRGSLEGNPGRQWFTYSYSTETRSVVKYSFVRDTLLDGVEETTEIELIKYGSGPVPSQEGATELKQDEDDYHWPEERRTD